MNLVVTPELSTTLTVCHPVTPKGLTMLMALAGEKLVRKAYHQGRVNGEVEIENINSTTYLLTWRDAESEDPVPDEADDTKKPFMPVNLPRTLSKGSGTYGSKETIGGVKVTIARDCATDEIGNLSELEEVIEFRLTQIAEQLGVVEAQTPDHVDIPYLRCTKQTLESILKRIAGPNRT